MPKRNSTHLIVRALMAAAIGAACLAAPAYAAGETDQSAPTAEAQHATKHARKRAASKPAQSLEARHEKCLAFVRRHDLSCDPWVVPTCGAETGYFRPPECVRPRTQ